ncbi:type I restriction enzyme S subunit [Xanthomonas campestris]|uniref:restriction endonuclease subunit S n=1 Tax=Xanthomonas campestris TaxID=339 RepID=UPI002169181A|nr:restriction endonuclease subunit S [Xanthomonas campestris]MCS3845559.1 type I restriction enzyme S subunit [Xanthomonas campestris]
MSEHTFAARPLRDAVVEQMGGGTPSRQVPSYWKGDIPWASVKDFPERPGIISGTQEYISIAGLNASASNLIPARIPLVCTRMAVGRSAMSSFAMAINQDVRALFPAADVSSAYLLRLLEFVRPKAEAQAVGSTVKGIRIQDYLGIEVPLADAPQQSKIAEILDTLDTAIHETEAIIAKLKAVKQGLLHDLLTRGIDANGELRPPQSEAPHLYRLSPLGWIPNEWVVDSAGSILAGIDAGWSPSCPEEPPSEGEWGVLKVSAVSGGAYDARQSKRLPPNLKPILSIEVRVGDVLLARANGVADLVAKTVLVRDTPTKLMLSDKILRLVPNEKFVRSDYLVTIMMHAGTRSQINGMMNGSSGQRNISQSQIRSIIVPIPPIIEQAASMERLNELVGRLEGEMKILQKRKSLKHALMDDLLTGRVRVTPLLDAATA